MTDKIKKFIDSLDTKTRKRLKEKLLVLKNDPFSKQIDIKRLNGAQKFFRMRIGKIRIIYKLSQQ